VARRIAAGAALVLWLLLPSAARAQIDEIQVYTGEINKPGVFSITLHDNYTAIGPQRPTFIGGIVPDHSLNEVPEYGLGLTPWLELGAYLPLYTVTRDGRMLIDGSKLRALFVSPNAAERTFWYGVNFEFSYNARHWQEARYAAEIRPILGWRFGPVDLLLNPIMDLPFHGGSGALTFAPAERVAYNLSETWALAVEHYADYTRFANFEPLRRQYHALYGVIDYSRDPFSLEFGIGTTAIVLAMSKIPDICVLIMH
jgi:opacity protein-like surface antigen